MAEGVTLGANPDTRLLINMLARMLLQRLIQLQS